MAVHRTYPDVESAARQALTALATRLKVDMLTAQSVSVTAAHVGFPRMISCKDASCQTIRRIRTR